MLFLITKIIGQKAAEARALSCLQSSHCPPISTGPVTSSVQRPPPRPRHSAMYLIRLHACSRPSRAPVTSRPFLFIMRYKHMEQKAASWLHVPITSVHGVKVGLVVATPYPRVPAVPEDSEASPRHPPLAFLTTSCSLPRHAGPSAPDTHTQFSVPPKPPPAFPPPGVKSVQIGPRKVHTPRLVGSPLPSRFILSVSLYCISFFPRYLCDDVRVPCPQWECGAVRPRPAPWPFPSLSQA